MSAIKAEADVGRFKETLESTLRLMIVATLPAMTWLIVLSQPVVALLFEHGRFTAEQSSLTAGVLSCLSLGLAGFGVNKLAASACYGAGDPGTPVKIVVFQTALNALLCFPLMRAMGASSPLRA